MASNPAPRIFRYVVAFDGGTAPRPFGGTCSLAICKPRIRATAEVGDWVIGFRRRRPGEVIYAMQVTETLGLGEYWLDPRFRDRRPEAGPICDNFYRPLPTGALEYVHNPVHGDDCATRDISGKNVLLSTRFWYFGDNSVPIPNELAHLIHTSRGHAVHKGRRDGDESLLRHWLAAWQPGVHGKPLDREIPEIFLEDASARPKRSRRCGS